MRLPQSELDKLSVYLAKLVFFASYNTVTLKYTHLIRVTQSHIDFELWSDFLQWTVDFVSHHLNGKCINKGLLQE